MASTMIGREERTMERIVVGGSTTEALGGAVAAILAILGLSDIMPMTMAAVAAIALGCALVLDSGMLAAEYSNVVSRAGNSPLAAAELGGGLSAQGAAGIGAIVLGILALIGMEPAVLLPVAAIALGAGIAFGSGVTSRINAVQLQALGDNEAAAKVTQGAVTLATGTQILSGVAGVVLGILALVGFAPTMLVLVSMLALGVAILLSGSAVAGRMLSLFP